MSRKWWNTLLFNFGEKTGWFWFFANKNSSLESILTEYYLEYV